MQTYHVKNVEEAIKLAEKLKAEGKYNWFRGQTEDWPPQTSCSRKIGNDPGEIAEYKKLIVRFLDWLKSHKSLKYIAENNDVDTLFGILQHYGIPTNYLDFSDQPAVAGFFASDCNTKPVRKSVIYLLNTEDFLEFYKPLSEIEENLKIELIEKNINNLWRLEAQSGRFLFVNHDWYDGIYSMDRIEFPWTGYPA